MREPLIPRPQVSPFSLLGDGFVMEVYFCGCKNKICAKYCHNKELQDFNYSECKGFTPEEFLKVIDPELRSGIITEVHLMGGEPLVSLARCQFVQEFIALLKSKYPHVKVIVFTGYDDPTPYLEFLKEADFIKYGHYDPKYPPKQISPTFTLASSNQHILQLNSI